jgi:hypothetical protein
VPVPTRTSTSTSTPTPTNSPTPTNTPSPTLTNTPSPKPTSTPSRTPSPIPTKTSTPEPTSTHTQPPVEVLTDCEFTNTSFPVIKGNIGREGEKIYHTPESRYYKQTEIDESKGEAWFCTVDEAEEAGWRKPRLKQFEDEAPEEEENEGGSDSGSPPSYDGETCDFSGTDEPVIKGNIGSNGDRIYHTPESPYYSRTKIDESKGERWFCTEEEAIEAGWRAPL